MYWVCWREGEEERQSNNAWMPETGDLVREGKRVPAPRLAERTALQGRGGVLAVVLPHACLASDWLPTASQHQHRKSATQPIHRLKVAC